MKKRQWVGHKVEHIGFWVSCSANTKLQIEEFFAKKYNYEIEIKPIINNGVRLFSLYTLNNPNCNSTNMLIITKAGIEKINKLCKSLNDEKKIYIILAKFFKKYLKDADQIVLNHIVQLLPILAQHYFENRDIKYLYDAENMQGRYLCILYPINKILVDDLNNKLNQIMYVKEDYIVKDRIYYT